MSELAFDAALEAQPNKTSIDFIFCDHSEENLSRVAEAVIASDGDIVAIEKIREGTFAMGTAAQKQELSKRMTHFISPGNGIEQSAAEYFESDEPFFSQLLDGLKGSGKRIELIDMGTDNPGYFLFRDARDALQAYQAKAIEGAPEGGLEEWETECGNLLLDYQIASARENEYREYTMGEQISTLANDNPGRKITVMTGAMHTPMSHELSRTHQITRTFVPAQEEKAHYTSTEKMRFSQSPAQIRLLRLHLGEFGLSTLDENNELVTA